jgi:two-component system LytT family response regulator
MHTALTIDDEPPPRAVLRTLLAAHPSEQILGEAGTITKARELLARSDYTLVFLDIQLRGGSGFDLVPLVRHGARIVFVTAHDEHALRAFDANALDYLLKPVKPERLAATLTRLDGLRPAESGALPARGLKLADSVYVRTDDGARFFPLTAIALLRSCENDCEIHLASGETLLVRHTPKAWENVLPLPPFARAHRQALINLGHLMRVEEDGGDAPLLHLTGLREPLRASRREWPNLRTRLPRENGETVRFLS